jgi:hypothetical protein
MMHKGLPAAVITLFWALLCSACSGSLFDSDLPVPMSYVIASAPPGSLTGVPTTLLVSSINDQGLFRSVTAEQARVATDYMLDVEVRHFESDYANGAPEAHVMIIGRLIRVVDRKLVTTVTGESRVAATAERMAAVTQAFEAASQKVALDLARQTAVAISNDLPVFRKAHGEISNTRTQNEAQPE